MPTDTWFYKERKTQKIYFEICVSYFEIYASYYHQVWQAATNKTKKKWK